MKVNRKRTTIVVLFLFALIVGIGYQQAYRLFNQNLTSKNGEAQLIYVYPETTFEQFLAQIGEQYKIAAPRTLRFHAKLMKWPGKRRYIKTGCYQLQAHVSDMDFITLFRGGRQTPIRLQFANIRTPQQLAACLSSQLMLDSADIIMRLQDDDYLQGLRLDKATAVSLFIPNTYEVYWNISPDDLFVRMQREYNAFWTDERKQLAEQLHLTQTEVATIASIVEEETNRDVDKPIIAGLYLNRLRLGMKLQACPTVKFAWKDFTLRRILSKHLEIDSPYNTYKYEGLPPGPIRIPTAKTMDYVLRPVQSNYLYMCASTAFDGTHHFSSSYAEHAAYARQYQALLNRRHIQ